MRRRSPEGARDLRRLRQGPGPVRQAHRGLPGGQAQVRRHDDAGREPPVGRLLRLLGPRCGRGRRIGSRSIAQLVRLGAFRLAAGDRDPDHGGIGFTWEHDLHLYFKRAKMDEMLFRDSLVPPGPGPGPRPRPPGPRHELPGAGSPRSSDPVASRVADRRDPDPQRPHPGRAATSGRSAPTRSSPTGAALRPIPLRGGLLRPAQRAPDPGRAWGSFLGRPHQRGRELPRPRGARAEVGPTITRRVLDLPLQLHRSLRAPGAPVPGDRLRPRGRCSTSRRTR